MFIPNMNILLPFLIFLFSFSTVILPKLNQVSNHIVYQIGTFASANILMYILLKYAYQRMTILSVTIFVKIIPTIVLSLLGFFVYRDTKLTFMRGLGMFAVIAGLLMMEL
jgi:hypothetical protein